MKKRNEEEGMKKTRKEKRKEKRRKENKRREEKKCVGCVQFLLQRSKIMISTFFAPFKMA
jgi:hypothetical protein